MTNLKCKLHNLGEKVHNTLDQIEEVCEDYYWTILTGCVAVSSLCMIVLQVKANKKH